MGMVGGKQSNYSEILKTVAHETEVGQMDRYVRVRHDGCDWFISVNQSPA